MNFQNRRYLCSFDSRMKEINERNKPSFGKCLAGNPKWPLPWLPVGKNRMGIAIQNVGFVGNRVECSWAEFCFFQNTEKN